MGGGYATQDRAVSVSSSTQGDGSQNPFAHSQSPIPEGPKELRKLDDPYGMKYARPSPELIEAFKELGSEEFDPNKLGSLEIKFPKDSDKPIRSYRDFLKKWYLVWLPSELFLHPAAALTGSDAVPGGEPLPETPGDFDKVIAEALHEARQDPKSKDMLRPAVIASEPFDQWCEEQTEEWDGTEQVVEVPSHVPRPGTVGSP